MLEIVEYQQHVPCAQGGTQHVFGRGGSSHINGQRTRNARGHIVGRALRGQLHKMRAIAKGRRQQAGGFHGQTCLAHTARAGQCHQADIW